MSITLACAVTRSEVRSTVHPYEAAVRFMGRVTAPRLFAALWTLCSAWSPCARAGPIWLITKAVLQFGSGWV
jgi:hypothetical protein